ncbi:MAG: DUF4350 domain-containing protein, partial [Propionicimonas sp.]
MRRWRGWLIAGGVVLVLFAALVVATPFLPESVERASGSITNTRGNGARALAQVLRANGVQVTQVTTLTEAVAAADRTTLAVYLTEPLSQEAATALANVPADLVLVVAGLWVDLGRLTEGALEEDWWWREDASVPVAGCPDPDARAAGRITPLDSGVFDPWEEATTCFIDDVGTALYARTNTSRHQLTVLATAAVVRNDTITKEGNAALALRVLGRHPEVTWYLPGPDALPAP